VIGVFFYYNNIVTMHTLSARHTNPPSFPPLCWSHLVALWESELRPQKKTFL
jgi:hypothetical protein